MSTCPSTTSRPSGFVKTNLHRTDILPDRTGAHVHVRHDPQPRFRQRRRQDLQGRLGLSTGTSWEDDYGYAREPACPRSSKLLFRGAPARNAAYLGKGYLIDNVTLSSGPLTSPAPRGIKQAVLAELQAQALKPMDGDTTKKINEAIKHLTKSVNSTAWLDDSHLATKDFDPVFNEEKATVAQLEDIKPTSGITRRPSRRGCSRWPPPTGSWRRPHVRMGGAVFPSTSAGRQRQKYNNKLSEGR